ncbi:MAG: recombinase family protein [Clostridium sp.]
MNGASINQIAKKMVELGVPNANGVPIWNHGPVGNILKNEQYLGTEVYPALMGTELFYKAQDRRQQVSRELGRIASRIVLTSNQFWPAVWFAEYVDSPIGDI